MSVLHPSGAPIEGVRHVLVELAELDGFVAKELADGRVVVDNPCWHRIHSPIREIRSTLDIDHLVNFAARCVFRDCPGRDRAVQALADRAREVC